MAGYGTPRVVEGEGIWLYDIRWTPTGKQFRANYEDLSPAILQQKGTGRVTFIDIVTLTPRGIEFSETATADELAALVEAELEKIASEGAKPEISAEMAAGTAKAIKALADEVASLKSSEAQRNKAGGRRPQGGDHPHRLGRWHPRHR